MNPRYQNENLMEIRASGRECEREKCGIKYICSRETLEKTQGAVFNYPTDVR